MPNEDGKILGITVPPVPWHDEDGPTEEEAQAESLAEFDTNKESHHD